MALKGRTTIQLFDGKTGELVRETVDENMITNAADNILNPPHYLEIGIDSETDRSYNMLHVMKSNIADTIFRGVIVCRDPIPENADNVMLPWTNEEIGHAGISNTSTDTTIGTYNSNESGRIENGNGYRHVWDFGTDKANGEIGCVCLTTKDGGTTGYHDTYWDLSTGGLDLNSASTGSFQQSVHAVIGRFFADDVLNSGQFKWFYMSRLADGNVRLLGKNVSDGGIYEITLNDPLSISVRTDKPFCGVVGVKKVIELFPAPSMVEGSYSSYVNYRYFHGDTYYDTDQSNINYVDAAEKKKIQEAWEANPQWLSYFPYVYDGKIHLVASSPCKVYHYTFDINTYAQLSKKIIDTDVRLQEYNIGFNYVMISNSSPRYRWFYGAQANTEWNNTLSGFYYDDMYFLTTENPIINGNVDTSINNFGQFRVFYKTGKATDKVFQYFANSSLSNSTAAWRGFYIDEKSGTPLLINDGNSSGYILAHTLRKTSSGYGLYRMRISIPTYGSNYLYSYANIIKVEDMSLPLYLVPNNPYSNSSGHYLGLSLGILKLCLTTINNLSSPVRKLDGQTMKITYDIVEE